MLVPQKNKNKLNLLLLEYHVINPDLFSLDPQGPKPDGTHKKGTFLFIYPGLYKFIDSCNPGDFSSEKQLNDIMSYRYLCVLFKFNAKDISRASGLL